MGPPFTNFVVDGVNTLNPGENAAVQANFDGAAVRMVFGIPRGNDGQNGSDGAQGPEGPPFASAVVDSMTTLNPGEAATVNTMFDGSNVRFSFGIPRGADGSPGPPGEVSQAQFDAAVASTSNKSNGAAVLGQAASGFYDEAQTQAVMSKLDELINALRR